MMCIEQFPYKFSMQDVVKYHAAKPFTDDEMKRIKKLNLSLTKKSDEELEKSVRSLNDQGEYRVMAIGAHQNTLTMQIIMAAHEKMPFTDEEMAEIKGFNLPMT